MGKAAVNKTIALLLSAVLCISPALPVFAAEDLSDVRDGALSETETPDAGNGADAAVLSGAVADTSYETESAGIFETIPDTSGERDLLPTVSENAQDQGASDAESALTPAGTGDYTQLHDPVTKSGVTTWDTVWFGNYWQEDTNGDGHCFAEDITVTKSGTDYYDQNGRRLYNFTGSEGEYQADEKQPIKWRVLDIDEDGNALLLSDRLIDIFEFDAKDRSVVWSESTVRSYLNGYEDYPYDSFIDRAFTNREKKAITESVVGRTENTYTGMERSCEAETNDKIFLLSLEEALNPDYGFVKNDVSTAWPYESSDDLSKRARLTQYVCNKPGYRGYTMGGAGSWWLRTPGLRYDLSCFVNLQGKVSAFGMDVNMNSICVRPALRINLSEESGVWSYAGSGSSDGRETVVVEDTEKPVTSGGVSTWHCVWFGDYWQEDTNGDGHCFSKNTRVTKSAEGYYFDQNGKMITGFDGNPGTYPADEKQPIKWRVLDIDEYGNALLLSDIGPEVLEYNEDSRDVTWEDSTSRSYLNGYNATYNGDFVDFSSKGFIDAAFNTDERKAISVSVIENKNNSVFGTNGGSKTKDRLFLLSMEEAMNSKYGFTENEFVNKPSVDYEGPNCYTENSPSRAAKVTQYGYDKPGYNLQRSVYTDCERWYLRTPARDLKSAAAVNPYGSVRAIGYNVNLKTVLLRPALRLNLAQYSYLWSDAGTVSSDGTVNEVAPVKKVYGVSLPEGQKDIILEAGESTVLKHTLKPENATEKSVSWKSSDDTVATVSSTGKVTGLKEGHVTITVRTKDGGYEAESKIWVRGINPGIDVVEGPDTEYLNMEMIPGETRRLIVNRYGVYVYGVRYKILSGKCITLKNGVVTAKNLKKGETSAVAEVEATHLDKTVKFTVNVKGVVPVITEGEKGKMIKAPKTLKLTAGINREVTVTLPKALQGKSVTPDSTDYGILSLGAAKPDPNGMKVSFPVTPKAAGAAYIIWTAEDGGNKSQFVTKAIVKRPVDDISLHDDEGFDSLSVGEGRRLLVRLPKDNTDQKDLSFRVKGKNVKCSKSGFVAVTDPNAQGTVTIKAGKTAKEKAVKAGPYAPDRFIKLNKTSVNVKIPKAAGKTATVKLNARTLPKGSDPLAVTWSLPDAPSGIKPVEGKPGSIAIDSTVPPGSYTVTAGAEGFNTAYCELILR